ncbi:hypothetical protein J4E93_010360 [Alternaria ventricosa]|uniref:uncharacterized protein n=1 Tax=Alternaria ventricosa TaxID=1187951 RepID=UPI0020C54DE5|nr:uncharacterized protein J4E93_010360 [Alternaria ventricosa]KAI4638204.1 hypothetical protein J4E93_010360 [Alternaria ventricosa]
MPQRSLYIAGLAPLLFAILYFQLGNLTSLFNHATQILSQQPLPSKPPIIMAATPAFSHMEKITTITQGLISRGYPVHFISGPEFQDYIESIGATYIGIEGQGPQIMSGEDLGQFISLQGDEQEVFAFKNIFIKTIPAQYRTLQRTFREFREQYGEKEKMVFLFDCTYGGLAPVVHGAPGIRPDASIAIGLAPYAAASNDTFPFRSGKYPDTSPESQKIHFEAQQAHRMEHPIDTPVNAAIDALLLEMGATTTTPSLYDMMMRASDVYLQYGIPAFEWERSDWRPHLRFMGAPVAVGIAEHSLPEWWGDVLEAKAAGKKIVAVSSSSVVYDTGALIKPALDAFGGREDVFVVATLVTSDVEMLDFAIPANARVAKFIPLDLALPDIDVLVTNGGYGTIQQSLRAGVPMVVSGAGQDKSHTGTLINYRGFGIYHALPQVTPELLTETFDKIVGNETYRKRLDNVKKEYEKYNAVDVVEDTIKKVVNGELVF